MARGWILSWGLEALATLRAGLAGAAGLARRAVTTIFTLAFVVFAGLPTAASAQAVRFPTATLPGITDKALINATIYKPEGAGPFPSVIVLHDSGGISTKDVSYAKKLASWGYVAIVPDSFGSRGLGQLRTNVDAVGARQRVQDTTGAAEYLATLPYVQKGNIGVLGFSHGGWTIMKGVQENAYWGAAGIKGAVAYYPYCTAPDDKNVVLPLRILMGENDDWTRAQRCKDVVALARNPSLIQTTYYTGVYHSFDCGCPTAFMPGQAEGKVATRRVEGNSSATRDAEAQTKAFFDRLLKGQ